MIRPEKSKRKIVIGIAEAVIVLLAVILMSIRITEITVTGNKQVTADELRGLLFKDKWDRNTIYCFYKDHFKEHEQIPFVEDYKIVFQSPTKVEVIVYEKSVVGYVSYMGSYMYFDKDGIIVESSVEQLPGVPWITGLDFGHIILHQPLPVADPDTFGEILNLTQVLSVHEVKVDKVDYHSSMAGAGEIRLHIGDVVVELGDSEDLDGKVTELSGILPELSGLSGTLYLDTYDETNSTPTYTFKKK